MKRLNMFANPVSLVAQGFLAGAILFVATHPETGDTLAARFTETASSAGAGAGAFRL